MTDEQFEQLVELLKSIESKLTPMPGAPVDTDHYYTWNDYYKTCKEMADRIGHDGHPGIKGTLGPKGVR